MPDPRHEFWHRQENESTKAFHAFMLYRDMGAKERSLELVRQKLLKTTGYRRHLQNWSSTYQWVARATAYDDHIAEVRRIARERAIEEMTERQAKIGAALQQVGMIHFLGDDGQINKQTARDMKEGDAVKAIEVGVKVERTARGEPTEIIKGDHTIRAAKELTDDELAEIVQREQLKEGDNARLTTGNNQ